MNQDILIKMSFMYSKTCVKLPLSKRTKIGFQDQLSLNAGQKYCSKLQFVIKIFVLSIFERPFYTGFTVSSHLCTLHMMRIVMKCFDMYHNMH